MLCSTDQQANKSIQTMAAIRLPASIVVPHLLKDSDLRVKFSALTDVAYKNLLTEYIDTGRVHQLYRFSVVRDLVDPAITKIIAKALSAKPVAAPMKPVVVPAAVSVAKPVQEKTKPKTRPNTAYSIYFAEKSPEIKAANPQMNTYQLHQEMTKRFNAMSEAEREPYKAKVIPFPTKNKTYMQFFTEAMLPKAKELYPDVSINTYATMRDMWNRASAEERKKYYNMEKADYDRFTCEFSAYKKAITIA